ncbi:glutamate-rich protein 6-like isoform X2 [Heptranchias perlo]|uniref:glutamate-rich protein 6-like isoform X2 n=1 Tax=Heptranchias perlo TaxID=212740 RepID=UPI00355A2F7F
MSEEHRPTDDGGVDEENLSMSAQPQSAERASAVTPENIENLQGQFNTTEELALENSVQDHVTQSHPSSVSSSLTAATSSFDNEYADKEFSLDEPLSADNSTVQISSEESRSTIEEVINVLRNLTSSDAESETSFEASLSSDSLQASESERKFSGGTGFATDDSPSPTLLKGEAANRREITTIQTQTVWISLDTPGSSLMELRMQIPEGLKETQSLETFSDSAQKKIEREESNIEEVGATQSDSEKQKKIERKESNIEAEKTERGESNIEDVQAEQSDSDNDAQLLMVNTANITICEFCNQFRMPFPAPEQLDSKDPDELFCCNLSWELYQQILMNREANPDYEEVSSELHGFHATEEEIDQAKMHLAKRLKNLEVVMYMSSVVYGDKVIFTQMKTISYRLSSEYCKKQGWTLRPTSATSGKSEDLSLYVPSVQFYEEPKRTLEIVEKYYPSGQKFLTRFPDGTGNVFYPSGNIAILIAAFHQGQMVYIILQDMDWNAKILGVFRSTGHGTCYLPNGLIWINVTPLCGTYFTEQGLTKKRWLWRDYYYHVHAPPYRSIALKLNSYINIRVISRDQIYMTFETKKRSVRFNMGAKLLLRDLEHFHASESGVTKEESYLLRVSDKIHRVLERIRQL